MKRWMCRMLYPAAWLLALLCVLSGLALMLVFMRGWEDSALAYVAYPVSAYALAALVLRCVPLPGKCMRCLRSVSVVDRYMMDREMKVEFSFYVSLAVTAVFCLYKAVMSWRLRSPWLAALAGFYLVLLAARFLLVCRIRSRAGKNGHDAALLYACGALLMLLMAALGAVSFYTVCRGESVRYGGYMIYAAAGFAFYSLVMALVNLVRFRALKEPVYLAGKVFALASALVSVYFLQASMLVEFAAGEDWHGAANAATGTAVLVFNMGMAIGLIRSGADRKKCVARG